MSLAKLTGGGKQSADSSMHHSMARKKKKKKETGGVGVVFVFALFFFFFSFLFFANVSYHTMRNICRQGLSYRWSGGGGSHTLRDEWSDMYCTICREFVSGIS